jgi:hypothetical protein
MQRANATFKGIRLTPSHAQSPSLQPRTRHLMKRILHMREEVRPRTSTSHDPVDMKLYTQPSIRSFSIWSFPWHAGISRPVNPRHELDKVCKFDISSISGGHPKRCTDIVLIEHWANPSVGSQVRDFIPHRGPSERIDSRGDRNSSFSAREDNQVPF